MINFFKQWRRKKKKKKRLAKIFLILLAVLALEIGFYYFSLHRFNTRLLTRPIKQALSFPYYLKVGFNSDYVAIIGDLNGLNKEGYKKVLGLTDKSYRKNKSFVLVPGLMPDKAAHAPANLLPADFVKQIANANGVVLVDNFCTDNWDELKAKQIYENSGLSPGAFCASEPQTQDLNRLLGVFNIKK